MSTETTNNADDILYSSADHKRIKDLFAVHKISMVIMGQLPVQLYNWLPSALRGLGWCLAYLYSLFMFLQTFHMAVLFVKTTYDKFENNGPLEDITDAMTMIVIYSFSSFITAYWVWRAGPLLDFMQDINRNYRHHSMAGLTYVSFYRSYDLARKVSAYWVSSCFGAVILWGIAPIMLRSRTLPLKCWYPFDPLQPVVYEIVYAVQLFAQIDVGNTYGNISALFASLAILFLGQYDVLFCSLKNLNYHARLLSGDDIRVLREIQAQLPMGKDDELNQYLFAEEQKTDLDVLRALDLPPRVGPHKSMEQALHESLIECVELHQFLLHSCARMEDLFSPFCLGKSLQVTVQLCLLVFGTVVGQSSMVRTVNLIQYFSLTVVELVLFTYCGELLRIHSARCGDSFWRSQWWTNGIAIRKDIVIFLMNSKRAVKLTAGKFYYMDVERLRLVITQAFSLMTLLQKIAKKNNRIK